MMEGRARSQSPQTRGEREMLEQAEEYRAEERAMETGPPLGEAQGAAGSPESAAAEAVRQERRDLESGAENPG